MHCSQRRLRDQVNSLRTGAKEAEELPFANVLPVEPIEEAVRHQGVGCRQRLFTPVITVLLWLFQAISADKSCAAAVRQFAALLVGAGRRPCSGESDAYCKARQRLPLEVIEQLARQVGRQGQEQAEEGWRWKGRRVKLVDGTTATMPDTPENQAEYPQPSTQRPGCGFPIVRMVGVFCLATGMMLELALGKYQGKQQGENSLARTLYDRFEPGDVMLADTYFCSYFDIALLLARGVDCVFRLHQRRPIDFRRGQRLGKNDHLITWTKPRRPEWMDPTVYEALPDELTLREVRLRRRTRPGSDKRSKKRKKSKKRYRQLVIVTTLLDPQEVSKADLDRLYRARWQVELDFRNIKQTLGMEQLRCKSPEMVRKEIWMHMLAYNLIRTLMAEAATYSHASPREISFKGTCQTLLAFACRRPAVPHENLRTIVLSLIGSCRVADRPGRLEPRAVKRRPKQYAHLREPRRQAKARLQKQVMA
jgi:hypothetical protein